MPYASAYPVSRKIDGAEKDASSHTLAINKCVERFPPDQLLRRLNRSEYIILTNPDYYAISNLPFTDQKTALIKRFAIIRDGHRNSYFMR
jgi:hypothetical protein